MIKDKLLLLPLFTSPARNDKLRREIFKNARDHVYFLAQELGERSLREYDNLNHAGYYIKDYIASFGFHTYEDKYMIGDLEVANIIAEIPGYAHPEDIVILGAHYDTVENSPGADDNGSAIAGLLEIFRLLSTHRYKKTIRFVAFTMEEPPHFSTENMGSMHYAAACKAKKENIELMICLEMIGYGGKDCKQTIPMADMQKAHPHAVVGDFLCLAALPSSGRHAQMWKHRYNSHVHSKLVDIIGPASISGIDLSDHKSFIKHGYPAIMLTDTGLYRNKNYHTPRDLPETLNYWFLADNIMNIYITLRDILNLDKFFNDAQ